VILPRINSRGRKSEEAVVELDPSMVKGSELFCVDLKNVNNFEKDLIPPNLSKLTIVMF